MRRLRLLLVPALVSLACAGADGPPALRLDRDACSRCSMLVSEPASAATVVLPDGEARTYDDLGCLLADLEAAAGGGAEEAAVWVYDRDTGAPLPAGEATFVRSPALATPMGGGVVAFAEPAAAAELVAAYGGELLRWGQLAARPPVAVAALPGEASR